MHLQILLVACCLQISKLRLPWTIIQVIVEEHRAKPHPGQMHQCPKATSFYFEVNHYLIHCYHLTSHVCHGRFSQTMFPFLVRQGIHM